ncbi:MAG TPA: agmatinase [Gemmatimonadaceae bacterium]|nr:agmatinase [Gemmatimonadaceae bacterium]
MDNTIALIGAPSDCNSSYLAGCAAAPAAVRAALHSPSANSFSENGVDIAAPGLLFDVGDLPLANRPSDHVAISAAVAAQLARGRRVLTIGGDHSITWPIVRAYAPHYPDLAILHFDAHPDLYDDFEGNPFSHASPFARIMEARGAARVIQIGIRTMTAHQRSQAERFGVEVIHAAQFQHASIALPEGPTYVSLDLDALDPAFAPGVSHHEPGGLSVRDILSVIQRAPGTIVGADVVELNPSRDVNGMTAMVAAKLVRELIGVMAAQRT